MVMSGFKLNKLQITGEGIIPAKIDFRSGLNAVTGPSDTGKSFIAETIDFLLGSSRPFTDIPEAVGYAQAFLEIETKDGQIFSLERNKRGGDFKVYSQSIDDISFHSEFKILKAEHSQGDVNTISAFLLNISQLSNKRLLQNKSKETRELTFRDLAHMLIIDEEQIITKGSPIWASGQFIYRTPESALFTTLITGLDYSGLIAQKKPAIRKAESEAQIALLNEMINQQKSLLSSVQPGNQSFEERIIQLDREIEEAIQILTTRQEAMKTVEINRNMAWTMLKKIESRMMAVKGFLERFELLKTQYHSDLDRLSLTIEAGHLISKLPQTEDCPLCGITQSTHSHTIVVDSEIESIALASEVERKKVQKSLEDLQLTIEELHDEEHSLGEKIATAQQELNVILEHLKMTLIPLTKEQQEKTNKLMFERSSLERALSIKEQLTGLEERRQFIEFSKKQKKEKNNDNIADLSAAQIQKFCLLYEQILSEWHYPDLQRVSFDPKTQDFDISGKGRGSHGKGYRAITYAAFTIALMYYCREAGLPHPGFALLDSPLVTYRKPDVPEGEGISDDMKEAFYKFLAKADSSMQFIVLENEDPPTSIKNDINYIHFTKSPEIGRYGFFPVEHSKFPALIE